MTLRVLYIIKNTFMMYLLRLTHYWIITSKENSEGLLLRLAGHIIPIVYHYILS